MRASWKDRFLAIRARATRDARGCLIWPKHCDTSGYGKFCRNGRYVGAHRVAWEVARGPIPDDAHVLHRCDNPPCFDETHLYLGTPLENARDKEAKGRANHARGAAHGRFTKPERTARGERNGRAVLTMFNARDIRKFFARGDSRADLTKRYCVSWTQIDRIVKGKLWKEVD
jgi:hypothetical protein